MKVKTYSAPSMKAVMAQVKDDFGEDALIISSKRIPKNSRDPYGRDLFEVQASLSPPSDEDAGSGHSGTGGEPDINRFVERISKRVHGDIPLRKKASPSGWELMQDELGSIREMLWSTNFNEELPELMHGHPEVFKIYSKLLKTGISQKRVHGFLHRGALDTGNASDDDYTHRVLKEVIASVETTDPFKNPNGSQRKKYVAAFIGPTGAGKTTTIAKLAAELGLKRKKKVGLISIDNYRIGALEQLKTYSSIIGLPCIPAFTAQDLVTALKKLESMDYILIDTAGQSHLDTKRMNEVKDLLDVAPEITKHLVISVATGRLDMKEAVDSFERLNPSTYVFSKVDETRRHGKIIDQIMEYKMPVSFITNGQEVPEDLIIATRKNVLELLINP